MDCGVPQVCGVPQHYDRAHALRGHASLDALRHPGQRTRSVQNGVTTRSVGTIISNRWIAACRRCVVCPNILIVPTLCVGMHLSTLCVIPDSGREASRTALPRGAWERSSQASLLLQMDCGVPQVKIVPTLRVGMHLSTLCFIPDSGRGASRTALPRGAWERSSSTDGLRRAAGVWCAPTF
jgi:hypothetical protein